MKVACRGWLATRFSPSAEGVPYPGLLAAKKKSVTVTGPLSQNGLVRQALLGRVLAGF